jgi:hypothetical protein
MATHFEERTYNISVWEHSAEENIWNYKRMRNFGYCRNFMIYSHLVLLGPSYHQDTGWLIITVSLWVVEVYQICTAYF